MPEQDSWQLFWAKTDRENPDSDWTRPLWAHLIDVANAALLLWEAYVPAVLRRRISAAFSMSTDEAGRFLSLWIGLHDLGKAIPSFQAQHKHSRELLSEHLPVEASYMPDQRMHHGHASIAIMRGWLQRRNLDATTFRTLESLAAFVGFHHGKLCTFSRWRDAGELGLLGNEAWRREQYALADAVTVAWEMPDLAMLPPLMPVPDWLLGFAGWVTLADWVGSMAEHYDDVDRDTDIKAYIGISRTYARRACKAAGFHVRPALHADSFRGVFPWIETPRDLQTTLADLPDTDPDKPQLIIVEAPTGEGKTEAALYRAARQQRGSTGQGIYVAMPSQATSNGLFLRFRNQFLPSAHPQGIANLRLIHGNDRLHPDLEAMLTRAVSLAGVYDDEETSGSAVRTLAWFLPRKRSLLAPYGVGTVDQAFLGVLFARHFFLRLFGLAGKTIIFDEVHAYDTYMSALFVHLLRWLKALGANVILLSATLPQAMRNQFFEAWDALPEVQDARTVPYPILWHTAGDKVHAIPFVATPGREQAVTIEWCTHELEAVAAEVRRWLKRGAAVAVICNTVARAQRLYDSLENALPEGDLALFHARYPFARRTEIEKQVQRRFSKDEEGNLRMPGPALLIATQVAEQSLDLDVDVMFSDLAPVDLLLQRAGRLWRHYRNDRPVEEPQFIVLCPPADGALPDLSDLGGWITDRADRPPIYDPILLWKTLQCLRTRGGWSLPEDYRLLIETVYDDDLEPPDGLADEDITRWKKARVARARIDKIARGKAAGRLVPSPDRLKELFKIRRPELTEQDDTDPSLHRDFQAITRCGGVSIEVVCLHQDEEGVWLDPACQSPAPFILDASIEPTRLDDANLRDLLGTSVRLGSKRVADYLLQQDVSGWHTLVKVNPALRRYRPLRFKNSFCAISDHFGIRYDAARGLIYETSNSTR